jgi:hypothetical protein
MKLRAMAALLAVCSLLRKPDLSVPIQRTSSTGRPLDFPHARQTLKECVCRAQEFRLPCETFELT